MTWMTHRGESYGEVLRLMHESASGCVSVLRVAQPLPRGVRVSSHALDLSLSLTGCNKVVRRRSAGGDEGDCVVVTIESTRKSG